MKCVFLVNAIAEIKPGQTTELLISTAAARGHRVFVAEVDGLSLDPDDRIVARAVPVQAGGGTVSAGDAASEEILLGAGDLAVVRTNPARDHRGWLHGSMLDLLAMAQAAGAVVINDPVGLRRASNKLYSSRVPRQLRPRTTVSRDLDAIRRFVRTSAGPTVLKPLSGTRGADVFKVHGDDPNLNQIIEVLARGGLVMAQEFLPAVVDGDVRVLVLDGVALTVDDAVAVVRRVPSSSDFRTNVNVGAVPTATEYTPELRLVVDAVAPLLAADGLSLCGLDVIGGKIIEINVFAAGGLQDANVFYGVDFVASIIEAFERRVSAAPAA